MVIVVKGLILLAKLRLFFVILIISFAPIGASAQSIGCDADLEVIFENVDDADAFGNIEDAASYSEEELVNLVLSDRTYAARLLASLVVIEAGPSIVREALQILSSLDPGAVIETLEEVGARAQFVAVISTLKVISTLEIEEPLMRVYDRTLEQAFLSRYGVNEKEVVAVFCVIEFTVEVFATPPVASPS